MFLSQSKLRASTSVRVLYTPTFTLKTYFFYFTHLFLQNTHISLFILSSVLFKKSFSYFSYYYSISNPLSPLRRLSHSRGFVLESSLKLLSIPTFSLLSKTPLYSKLSEISIQAGSTAPIWNSDPSWNFHLKFKCRSEISIWNSDPSMASIWNSDPSTARRTLIQAWREERRSKHGERNSYPSTTRRALIQAHWSTTSADPLLSVSVGVSVCGCVWFCSVYGWFCCWFCGWF